MRSRRYTPPQPTRLLIETNAPVRPMGCDCIATRRTPQLVELELCPPCETQWRAEVSAGQILKPVPYAELVPSGLNLP